MKSKVLLIFVLFSLFSCVVPRNYSRAKEKVDRIVNKFPDILQNDTILLTDTLYIPEVITDTLFKLSENDTIFINKEKLKVRIIRLPGDTIQLTAECKTDTIFRSVKVPIYTVEKHNLLEKKFFGLGVWTWILIVLILLLLAYIKLKK